MQKSDSLTRGLALVGTILMWIPLIAPLLLSIAALVGVRQFLLDFLMPAELFPLSVFGFGLLFWAAFRAHSRQKLIGWGFVIAVALLILSQAIAVWTGLASGAAEPTTMLMTFVLLPYGLYVLSLIVSSIGGARLTYACITSPAHLKGDS
jgi:hypothetical protein